MNMESSRTDMAEIYNYIKDLDPLFTRRISTISRRVTLITIVSQYRCAISLSYEGYSAGKIGELEKSVTVHPLKEEAADLMQAFQSCCQPCQLHHGQLTKSGL